MMTLPVIWRGRQGFGTPGGIREVMAGLQGGALVIGWRGAGTRNRT
jgi:hypothetical protein